jgi:SulP family sulfate permease
VYLFELPVSTIETSFGEIPNKLPMAVIPDFTLDKFYTLFQPALAIALLGGIESLLSAVVSDGMIGGKHRPNAELIAQGIANCFSSLFGGIPATGAIARTATNITNGGRTPVAGIVHSLVLLFIMILLAPLAKLIPMACLAGILIVVAYHMSEWRQFRILLKGNKGDVLILLITFFLTVFFDLILAIEVGVVLSSFLLMKRLSETFIIQTNGQSIGSGENERDELFENELSSIPKGIALFEINGALFFGAAQGFQDTMNQIRSKPKVLILRMRNVPFIDATGIYRLKEIIKQFNAQRIPIILSGVKPNVQVDLEHNGLFDFLDTHNFCETILEAIERASELMKQKDK